MKRLTLQLVVVGIVAVLSTVRVFAEDTATIRIVKVRQGEQLMVEKLDTSGKSLGAALYSVSEGPGGAIVFAPLVTQAPAPVAASAPAPVLVPVAPTSVASAPAPTQSFAAVPQAAPAPQQNALLGYTGKLVRNGGEGAANAAVQNAITKPMGADGKRISVGKSAVGGAAGQAAGTVGGDLLGSVVPSFLGNKNQQLNNGQLPIFSGKTQ